MSVTEEQLAEAERLHAAATAAPWGYKAGRFKHYVFSTDTSEDFGASLQEMHWRDGHAVPAAENAQLVAYYRNNCPAFVAEIRALRGEVERLKKR